MPLTLQTNPTDTACKRRLVALCCDAMEELNRACLKFPAFPDKLDSDDGRRTSIAHQLERAREWNDRDGGSHADGYSVFCEEFLEFVEAAKRGDRQAADTELVQSMAMLMRIALHLDDYCPAKQTGNAQHSTLNANAQRSTLK